MSHINSIRHILLSLIGSITKLDTLISGTNRIKLIFVHLIFFLLQSLVYTHCNISRLLVKCSDNSTGVSIKAIFSTSITNLTNGISYDSLNVNVRLCCNFTHNKNKTCSSSCLTCYTAHRILRHQGIENRIRNGIADFVRMSFSYRFRSK